MDKKKQDVAPTETPAKRYDRPGHLDPAHAERLLELAREGRAAGDDSAFLRANAEDDELASRLGETTVASMTSGEPALAGEWDVPLSEELGGPFVVMSVSDDLAEGTDVTTLANATRDPLSGAKALRHPAERAADDGEKDEEGAAAEEPRASSRASARTFTGIYLPRASTIARWFGQRLGRSVQALRRSTFRKAGQRLRRAS
jgi:hypothetical protein